MKVCKAVWRPAAEELKIGSLGVVHERSVEPPGENVRATEGRRRADGQKDADHRHGDGEHDKKREEEEETSHRFETANFSRIRVLCLATSPQATEGLEFVEWMRSVTAMTNERNRREERECAGARLLHWYEGNRRDLPWRRTQDPYAILVAEIMLQQTRVETVLPYYERFLNRFATVQELSSAAVEEVLSLWSGLGYYRRARLLHQAARRIVAAGGEVPQNINELERLPGVGSYTAAAVGSIAFGHGEPAVDGNVERVITRLFRIAGDPKRLPARKRVRAVARELLDPDRPGDSNQALMELGARVCRPRNPVCVICPLAQHCRALLEGSPEEFPHKGRSPETVRLRRQIAVVRDGAKVLLFRRPDDSGLLAGMWELPWIDGDDRGASEESFRNRYGGRWRVGKECGRVRHAVTHHLFDVGVREASVEVEKLVGEGSEAGWFDPAELSRLPVSSLVRKALGVFRSGSDASTTSASGE